MNNSTTVPNPTPHITLFMDFLGFSRAVETSDRSRIAQIARILLWLSDQQSSFDIVGSSQPDGSFKFNTKANITTFSDHVVLSYPFLIQDSDVHEAKYRELLQCMWIDLVLKHMQEVIAVVATEALELDFLMRGGIALGDLFHRRHVVIGKAMIDSHHLENEVAINPRILVGESLLQLICEEDRHKRLLCDGDGQWHLDYFTLMGLLIDQRQGEAATRAWRGASLMRIATVENALRTAGDVKNANKWKYFGSQLDGATIGYS